MLSTTFDPHHNQEWSEWDSSAWGAGADVHPAPSLQASQTATLVFPRKEDKATH